MKIERLGRDDSERLRRIRLRALQDSPEAFGSTHSEEVGRAEADWRALIGRLVVFVATEGGVDSGLVRVDRDRDVEDVAWLLSMWVAPGSRGRGIGLELVRAAIEWARGEDFKSVKLDVADQNTAAIALYERCGFRPTGVVGSLPAPRAHISEHQLELHL